MRRVAEIYTTLQTKKWNGAASTELLEDSGVLNVYLLNAIFHFYLKLKTVEIANILRLWVETLNCVLCKCFVSDDERGTPMLLRSKRGRKKSVLSGAAVQEFVGTEKEKVRALVHQTFLQRVRHCLKNFTLIEFLERTLGFCICIVFIF